MAALLLAGCGGGGGGSASDDIESSIKQFIQDADCSVTTEEYRKELTGDADVKKCSRALSQRNKVKKLSIGEVTSSGNSGTAAVTTDGDKVDLKLVKEGDKWLIAGDAGVEEGSSSAPEKTTPSTTPADSGSEARVKYALALVPYQAARKRFEKNALEDIKAQNIAAVQCDFNEYRDAVFNLDAEVRKIDFPTSAQAAVTELLEANRAQVAGLDAVGAAPSFQELQRLLRSRLDRSDKRLRRALTGVSSAL